MLSFQKAASTKTGLGYDFSFPNIATSSTTVFVSSVDNVNSKNGEAKIEIASDNLNKGKSILEAPLKIEKKETRNPRNKTDKKKKKVLTKEAAFLSSLWSFRAYSSKLLQVVSYSTKQ